MQDDPYPFPMPRPLGVTIVGVLLVIGAAISIMSIFATYAMPISRYAVEQNYASFGAFVFFSLTAAGLILPSGIGMLTRRTWGRLMYLVAIPVYLLTSVVINGLHPNLALPFVIYCIFACVLNCRECVEYFSLWPIEEGRGRQRELRFLDLDELEDRA